MIIELSDKALNTILKMDMEHESPDISWFKRDVTIELSNILGGSQSYIQMFSKNFEKHSAERVINHLSQEKLKLKIYETAKKEPALMVFQRLDLSTVFPTLFKDPYETEFIYLNVSVGKEVKVLDCFLGDNLQKVIGLVKIFNLIAYYTLNHVKQPRHIITVSARRIRSLKRQYDYTPSSRESSVRYFKNYTYDYETKVNHVKKRSTRESVSDRNFYLSSWTRRGHWRTIRYKNGKQKRIWVESKVVSRSEELLLNNPSKRVRITNMGIRKVENHG